MVQHGKPSLRAVLSGSRIGGEDAMQGSRTPLTQRMKTANGKGN